MTRAFGRLVPLLGFCIVACRSAHQPVVTTAPPRASVTQQADGLPTSYEWAALGRRILGTVALDQDWRFLVSPLDDRSIEQQAMNCASRTLEVGDDIATRIRRNENDWSAIGAIAHRIAHCLNGTAVIRSVEAENAADHFAGFVLGRLGASLSDVEAVSSQPFENNDARGLGRASRLRAIEGGWRLAMGGPRL